MPPVISAQALTKSYGKLEAVRGIEFEIFPGECFGFLGPNGAGKSSTMRMLYQATRPTSGELCFFGEPLSPKNEQAIKKRIVVIPQDDNLDEVLTVEENLLVFAQFHGLRGVAARNRITELLGFVQLEDKRKAVTRLLSGGQKRRTLIARGLLGEPEILILDEPTTGLDPQARQHLWSRLRALKSQNKTLILTTHYMEEAEQLCDRILIMDEGKIVEQGTPRALIEKHVGKQVVEISSVNKTPELSSTAKTALRHQESFGDRYYFYTENAELTVSELSHQFPQANTWLRRATLEDVFLRITGRRLSE